MAAGLSPKQFYTRIYNRLHRIQGELRVKGVGSVYKNRQLGADQNVNPGTEWNISYSTGHMSNGEAYGLPQLTVHAPFIAHFDHLSFDRGIKQLVETIGKGGK